MTASAFVRVLLLSLIATTLQAQSSGQNTDVPDERPATEPANAETAPAGSTGPATDPYARDSYRLDAIVCPFKGEIDYQPGDIDCFLLEVPENREKPDSRMIELHVARLNARAGRPDQDLEPDEKLAKYAEGLAPGKREDPVVYLTGGPGAHASYYVERFKDHALVDHRDLYILEQRGIGASDDFCPFFNTRKPADDNVATFEEYLDAQLQDRIDCATNARAAGVDLEGYNTIENARDVKALRRALGFEAWNVWGISYGTILGQAYLKEDPEGILAAVLDANMPLDIRASDEYWRVIKWFIRDLEKLQAICDEQPACAEHYPDMIGRLRDAARSVETNPIGVDVEDTEVFPSGKAYVFGDVVALLPFSLFYEQSNYPGLPGLIYAWADAVERRDDTLFRALASFMGGGDDDISPGMHNAILCADGDADAMAAAGKKDLEEFPVLGSVFGTPESLDLRAAACVELGMTVRPPAQYAPVHTDIPTLIVEGEMDPITPPPNARAILGGFANGTYVEFPYAGHGPTRSVDCAGYMLNKFYDDPAEAPDLACAEDMATPELWAPIYPTRIAPKLALLAADDPKRLAAPGAWAGISALVLLISFVVLTFAPFVRVMDGRFATRAGSARAWTWLTGAVAMAGLITLGVAAAMTAEAGEVLLVFGLVPWARWGGWLLLAGGIIGIIALIATFRARSGHRLPFGAFVGFLLTALAAIGLASFAWIWGLGPVGWPG